MNETLQSEIAFLNERGKKLQKLLLPLADDELKKITPTPTRKIINELKKRALYYTMILSGEIN